MIGWKFSKSCNLIGCIAFACGGNYMNFLATARNLFVSHLSFVIRYRCAPCFQYFFELPYLAYINSAKDKGCAPNFYQDYQCLQLCLAHRVRPWRRINAQIWMSTGNILTGNFYYFNSNDLHFDDVSHHIAWIHVWMQVLAYICIF